MNNDRSSAASRISATIALFATKREAADAAGVSTDQLGRYEKGLASPPLDVITRLSVAKGVSLDWLATGKGRMRLDERSYESSDSLPPADDDELALWKEMTGIAHRMLRDEGLIQYIDPDKFVEVVGIFVGIEKQERARLAANPVESSGTSPALITKPSLFQSILKLLR